MFNLCVFKMKSKLLKYYKHLNNEYIEYKFIKDGGGAPIFVEDMSKEEIEGYYDRLVDAYCEFIDVYSVYCDVIIEKSNDEELISQSMMFYYMMNKEYFASRCEEDDVKNVEHILKQLEPHEEILNYEFFYEKNDEKILCELCGNEGDIPDCILCGRPSDYKEQEKDKKRKINRKKQIYCRNCGEKKCQCGVSLYKNGSFYDGFTGKSILNEVYCEFCDCYISKDNFNEHMKFVHYIDFEHGIESICIVCSKSLDECCCTPEDLGNYKLEDESYCECEEESDSVHDYDSYHSSDFDSNGDFIDCVNCRSDPLYEGKNPKCCNCGATFYDCNKVNYNNINNKLYCKYCLKK